jgi:hypothetical protein
LNRLAQLFVDLGIERNRCDERLGTNVKAIGDEVLGRALVNCGFFCWRNGGFELRRSSQYDVALDFKDVAQAAVVVFFPRNNPSPSIYQMDSDAYVFTGLADAPFQGVGYAQSLG